MSEMIFNWN